MLIYERRRKAAGKAGQRYTYAKIREKRLQMACQTAKALILLNFRRRHEFCNPPGKLRKRITLSQSDAIGLFLKKAGSWKAFSKESVRMESWKFLGFLRGAIRQGAPQGRWKAGGFSVFC